MCLLNTSVNCIQPLVGFSHSWGPHCSHTQSGFRVEILNKHAMRKELWNEPVAWRVPRLDSEALGLGLYPSAAGTTCFLNALSTHTSF